MKKDPQYILGCIEVYNRIANVMDICKEVDTTYKSAYLEVHREMMDIWMEIEKMSK